eukprot:15442022-Alexandrium_andersonii.AAC.1
MTCQTRAARPQRRLESSARARATANEPSLIPALSILPAGWPVAWMRSRVMRSFRPGEAVVVQVGR